MNTHLFVTAVRQEKLPDLPVNKSGCARTEEVKLSKLKAQKKKHNNKKFSRSSMQNATQLPPQLKEQEDILQKQNNCMISATI